MALWRPFDHGRVVEVATALALTAVVGLVVLVVGEAGGAWWTGRSGERKLLRKLLDSWRETATECTVDG